MALGVILFLHHPAVLADPAPVKVSSEQQHGSVFPVTDPRGDAAETYRVMESVLERTRSRTEGDLVAFSLDQVKTIKTEFTEQIKQQAQSSAATS